MPGRAARRAGLYGDTQARLSLPVTRATLTADTVTVALIDYRGRGPGQAAAEPPWRHTVARARDSGHESLPVPSDSELASAAARGGPQ